MYLYNTSGKKCGISSLWEPKRYVSKRDIHFIKVEDERRSPFLAGEWDREKGHSLTRTLQGEVLLDITRKIGLSF
jgi:hypothetical protein